MRYLKDLNKPQQKAVIATEGPLLVFAGAGAGKTRTIAHRIFHLIKTGVRPENILAITFTNKAAGEMRERVRRLVEEDRSLSFPHRYTATQPKKLPFIATFHALGAWILREEARAAGLSRHYSILDREDTLKLIKRSLRDDVLGAGSLDPRKILGGVSSAKGAGLSLQDYEQSAGSFYERAVARVWRHYEKMKREAGALDFDDLLLCTNELFRAHRGILQKYQDKFQYIHIDEYQDTNGAQYTLSNLLAGERKNICVVGDNDQSIYGWRGADFENILNFKNDYPEACVVTLEENYRSTKRVLRAAEAVIEKNMHRVNKRLFTRNSDGEKISLCLAPDEHEEASFIAERAGELISRGLCPHHIGVLYRTNFQSRVLEESFLAHGVPHQVVGVRFFERKEVKDVLAFLKAALNERDRPSLERIINVPPRGIGKVTLAKMFAGQEQSLSPNVADKVSRFRKILHDIRSAILQQQSASYVIKFAMKRSGIEAMLAEGGDDDLERLENIKELVSLARKYDGMPAEEGITALLADAALASEQDTVTEDGGVKLMTVHAAKGLEFHTVFISGLEEDLFPHRALSQEHDDPEEERRLFYVALTRAQKKLYLSYAEERTVFGNKLHTVPSSFITDIPEELFDVFPANTLETISVT